MGRLPAQQGTEAILSATHTGGGCAVRAEAITQKLTLAELAGRSCPHC
jgi:hypothetical protein